MESIIQRKTVHSTDSKRKRHKPALCHLGKKKNRGWYSSSGNQGWGKGLGVGHRAMGTLTVEAPCWTFYQSHTNRKTTLVLEISVPSAPRFMGIHPSSKGQYDPLMDMEAEQYGWSIWACIYKLEDCRPIPFWFVFHSSVQFSCSVMSNTLRPHGLQHARLPCPSPTLGDCSNSCPLSRWCHPTISSSVFPFSSCLQSFPASGSFPMSHFFASGGQSTGASASVLPMNTQDWSPLGRTGWISLQSKGLSNTTVQKHQFFGAQLSLWSNSHIHDTHTWIYFGVWMSYKTWTSQSPPASSAFESILSSV